jgi:hypothetical protein
MVMELQQRRTTAFYRVPPWSSYVTTSSKKDPQPRIIRISRHYSTAPLNTPKSATIIPLVRYTRSKRCAQSLGNKPQSNQLLVFFVRSPESTDLMTDNYRHL